VEVAAKTNFDSRNEWVTPKLKKFDIAEITASGQKSTTSDHGSNKMAS
jgi:hypothetical protein